MSKRDIKAKRWFRGRMKREFGSEWEWVSCTAGKLKAIAAPVSESKSGEQPLRFFEQVRQFGDGRWQYREAVTLRRVSLRRRAECLSKAEWRDS